jgi:hypothetical protein
MFHYLYWPEDWATEVAAQLRRVQAQVQLVLTAEDFKAMEAELFRLVNRGVYIEMVLYEREADRQLRYVNVRKRLVLAGVEVVTVQLRESDLEMERFAIMDRRHLISHVNHGEVQDVMALVVDRTRFFQRIFQSGERMDPALDEVQIRLQCPVEEVDPGQPVEISWEVRNADFIEMDPGVGPLEPEGRLSIPLFEDTLFRIKAGNRNGMRMKSLLVRLAQPSLLRVSVSVLDPATRLYIPLESASVGLHSYAVLRGDQLRVEWAAPASAILSEEKLGSLASVGDHLVRVFRDEKYIFTLRTTFGDERVVLDIVTMDEQMSTIVKPGGRPPLPWKRKRPQQPQQAVRFNLGRWFDRFLNFFTR